MRIEITSSSPFHLTIKALKPGTFFALEGDAPGIINLRTSAGLVELPSGDSFVLEDLADLPATIVEDVVISGREV